MDETAFTVTTALPWSWQTGPRPDALRSNLLLLRVANLLDLHEMEQEGANKRIEAKLDLMLHWLGRQLFGEHEIPPARPLALSGHHAEWTGPGNAYAEGNGWLSLFIHPDLPAPLTLPGQLSRNASGLCHVECDLHDPEMAEAWERWLFRLHRRAIHEARNKTAPD